MEKQTTPSTTEHQRTLEALLNGPAYTPPAGVQPNFDSPANLNTITITITTLAFTLTTLAVLIRIYTRHHLSHSMGHDDCTFRSPSWFRLKYSNAITDTSVLAWVGFLLSSKLSSDFFSWD